jgi:hypothetical protein
MSRSCSNCYHVTIVPDRVWEPLVCVLCDNVCSTSGMCSSSVMLPTRHFGVYLATTAPQWGISAVSGDQSSTSSIVHTLRYYHHSGGVPSQYKRQATWAVAIDTSVWHIANSVQVIVSRLSLWDMFTHKNQKKSIIFPWNLRLHLYWSGPDRIEDACSGWTVT